VVIVSSIERKARQQEAECSRPRRLFARLIE
jgi:hypothetical protein